MNESTNPTDRPISADAGPGVAAADTPETRADGTGASRPLPDDALIIVPVRNIVLFPGMVFPLTVGRERSRAAVYEAVQLQDRHRVAACAQSPRSRGHPGRCEGEAHDRVGRARGRGDRRGAFAGGDGDCAGLNVAVSQHDSPRGR
jgi:ATP-dependent protease La (LON) substrate-binding domain